MQSHGLADEIYASFEAAAERFEKQLRRFKRRLRDNTKGHRRSPSRPSHYVITAAQSDDTAQPGEPVIIAETEIRTLTVGEAVRQMAEVDAPVLVFHNLPGTGVNVVYRRANGNIGCIEPGDSRGC